MIATFGLLFIWFLDSKYMYKKTYVMISYEAYTCNFECLPGVSVFFCEYAELPPDPIAPNGIKNRNDHSVESWSIPLYFYGGSLVRLRDLPKSPRTFHWGFCYGGALQGQIGGSLCILLGSLEF